MRLSFPKRVFSGLLKIILLLATLHLIAFFSAYFGFIHYNDLIFQKLNFDEEKNLPSVFSSLLLFSASIILGYIGTSKLKVKTPKYFWWSLSFLFLFLAADELLRIHELSGRQLSTIIDSSGIFYYSWLIPYLIIVTLIGLLYLKPLIKLPKKSRRDIIFAGIIYLTGVMGLEMLTGWIIDYRGLQNAQLIIIPEFFILYTLEELLEMIGISYFIFVLLEFLETYKVPLEKPKNSKFIK